MKIKEIKKRNKIIFLQSFRHFKILCHKSYYYYSKFFYLSKTDMDVCMKNIYLFDGRKNTKIRVIQKNTDKKYY